MKLKIAVGVVVGLTAIILLACARPLPMPPTPRVIVAVPTLSAGYYHPAAIEDYTGAGYSVPGISLAGHANIVWSRVNPGNGLYDWDGLSSTIDGLDDYLAATAAQTVTLLSGDVISRPVWVTIPSFWIQGTGGNCANYVPSWVRILAPDYIVNGQSVPAMDDPDFQAAYRSLVLGLASHIQNDLTAAQRGRIAGFFIPAGYDNENSIEGDYCGVTAGNVPITQAEYWTFLSGAVQAFHDALPGYPAFTLNANYTWAAQNCQLKTLLESYTPRHIGWGFNGMGPDVPGWIMRPAGQVGCGSLEVVQRTLDVLPVKFEPAAASASYQAMYWSWLLALGAFRVDTVDMQNDWFEDGDGLSQFDHFSDDYGFPASFWPFLLRQLGDTAETTQDVWTAFHTTEYPRSAPGANDVRCYDAQGNIYCHGFEGDIHHFLAVSSGTITHRCSVAGMPGCQDSGLPTHTGTAPWGSSTNIYSRQAGRLDSAVTTLVVSPTLAWYGEIVADAPLRLAWLGDATGSITITYQIGAGDTDTEVISRVNDGAWHWTEIVLSKLLVQNDLPSGGIMDIRYSGAPLTLHMVWIDLSNEAVGAGGTPTPTPTWTPTPAPTVTPTPTPWVGSVAFSEYSLDVTHDWYPDGRADAQDQYIEIYNGVGAPLTLAGYGLEIVTEGVTLTYPVNVILPTARYYVVWNPLGGLTLPVTPTLRLVDALGTPVASTVVTGTASAGQSLQLCGGVWVSALGTPGEACGYWAAVATPTAMP